MAKKKRKKQAKKPPSRPSGADTAAAASRAERKEAARRERERRIKAAKRRRLMRRAVTWGIVLLVIGSITGFVVYRNVQESQRREQVLAIATSLGCGEPEQDPNRGQEHVPEPPQYQDVPATSGPHSSGTLPPEVSVYDQPFDPTFEFRAVHNLEHGYVIMYYRGEGDDALDQGVVDRLSDLARDEPKVMLAPYPNLPEGENLVFVAWRWTQRCDLDGDIEMGDLTTVARGFIDRFREGADAPEPHAP